ncbi:Alpha/Beta hydrolase protein [Aspergillus carlsbadensis]|nr:Alpha/Beta hydrolase protein [Aspergillus carlsbadensis]
MPESLIKPFKVDIPKAEVDRLKAKLNETRLPGRSIVPDAGPKYEWASNLYETWKNDFDWYVVQEEMDAFPHYMTEIEDINIHFLYAKARRKDFNSNQRTPIPLLMIHGWPGSFWEFSQVWQPLSQPNSPHDLAFDVVAPSMPGFCWSSWPPRAGWTLKDTARIFDTLMRRLGYETYMVQCGDWGQFVGRELGAQYTESCKLVHLNFAPSPLPEGVEYTEREEAVASGWAFNDYG